MNWLILIAAVLVMGKVIYGQVPSEVSTWKGSSWYQPPILANTWNIGNKIPMIADYDALEETARKGSKFKVKKKFRRFLLPLLLAYKLKFFTLIPVLIGGLVLLTGATGLAGFFFALFAAVMGLKKS